MKINQFIIIPFLYLLGSNFTSSSNNENEEGCFFLVVKESCDEIFTDESTYETTFTSMEKCQAFVDHNYSIAKGSWRDEHCDIQFVHYCAICADKKKNNSNSKNNINNKKAKEGKPSEDDDIIRDEYDPSIEYRYNEETGEYEQIQLDPEYNAEEEMAYEEELRKAKEEQKQQKIINRTGEGITNSLERHRIRKEKLREARSNVKDEELPIIEEDIFNADDNSNSTLNETEFDPVSEIDDMASEFSSYLKTASTASIVMDNESLENFTGSAKQIVNHISTGIGAYELAQNPNDIEAQGDLFEDVIAYTAKAAGTSGAGIRQFSPPVNLWEQTYKASFERAGSLLNGKPSSEIDVWAPTLNYLGRSSNTGSVGSILSSYNQEKELSWGELTKRHGTINGTWRKIWFDSINDLKKGN